MEWGGEGRGGNLGRDSDLRLARELDDGWVGMVSRENVTFAIDCTRLDGE